MPPLLVRWCRCSPSASDVGDRGDPARGVSAGTVCTRAAVVHRRCPAGVGLIASLYIGNVMLLVLNLPLAGLWVRLLTIPRSYLHAGILVLSSVGAYSVNRSVFDLVLLYVIGGVGYVMRRTHVPRRRQSSG